MRDTIERQLDKWQDERPELDPSPLAIVNRIILLAVRYRRQGRKALRPFRLELWEYDVLSALRRQGPPFELPPTTLAKMGMLTTGAMTNRIDRLEQRDLVERRPDPDDRRSILVKLTAKGLNLIDHALEGRFESAAQSVSVLSDGEAHSLAQLLKKLVLASEDRQ